MLKDGTLPLSSDYGAGMRRARVLKLAALIARLSDPSKALWDAAKRGDAVKVLKSLGYGVNANQAGKRSRRALHLAALGGHEAVVRLLLEKGANVDATDWIHSRALHEAAQNGHEAVVRLLLEGGGPHRRHN
jgi:ankyrin repeat protein